MNLRRQIARGQTAQPGLQRGNDLLLFVQPRGAFGRKAVFALLALGLGRALGFVPLCRAHRLGPFLRPFLRDPGQMLGLPRRGGLPGSLGQPVVFDKRVTKDQKRLLHLADLAAAATHAVKRAMIARGEAAGPPRKPAQGPHHQPLQGQNDKPQRRRGQRQQQCEAAVRPLGIPVKLADIGGDTVEHPKPAPGHLFRDLLGRAKRLRRQRGGPGRFRQNPFAQGHQTGLRRGQRQKPLAPVFPRLRHRARHILGGFRKFPRPRSEGGGIVFGQDADDLRAQANDIFRLIGVEPRHHGGQNRVDLSERLRQLRLGRHTRRNRRGQRIKGVAQLRQQPGQLRQVRGPICRLVRRLGDACKAVDPGGKPVLGRADTGRVRGLQQLRKALRQGGNLGNKQVRAAQVGDPLLCHVARLRAKPRKPRMRDPAQHGEHRREQRGAKPHLQSDSAETRSNGRHAAPFRCPAAGSLGQSV